MVERPPSRSKQSPPSNFDVNLFLKKTLSNYQIGEASPGARPRPRQLPPPRPQQPRWRSERDIYYRPNPCAYCGQWAADESFIYCQNCMELFRNSPEVARKLLEQQVNDSAAEPSNYESASLLQRHVLQQQPRIVPPDAISLPSSSRKSAASGFLRRMMTPASSRVSLNSISSSAHPLCRICQLFGESDDPLVSPCRCAGTMQFVHKSCLVHWLEISTKKMCLKPRCELCNYQYQTFSMLRPKPLHCPTMVHRDKILHFVFVLMMIVMFGCATMSIFYLQMDRGIKTSFHAMTTEDIMIVCCSVMFFLAFFVGVFTQYRSESTICSLCFRCWMTNKHWRIRNYDSAKDPKISYHQPAPSSVVHL